MTRYETITSLGDDFMKLLGKNLIPVHILDWKVYYEAYVKEKEFLEKKYGKNKKTRAVGNVCDTYKISERNLFYIISFMDE